MYEPAEDSYLLQKYVRMLAKGNVLDVGTGSGIQAETAAEKGCRVVALDKDPEVIRVLTDKKANNNRITFIESDLFRIPNKKNLTTFDTVIFNPPYLPSDQKNPDPALDGGKKGYEILETFLNQVSQYLKSNGLILIVFSSLSNKEKIDELVKANLLEAKELESKKIAFETLYCYKIEKSPLLKELEGKGLKNIHILAKGHRSIVYKAEYQKKKVAVKVALADSAIRHRIEIEKRFLNILNQKTIGPKLIASGDKYIIMDYIEGTPLRKIRNIPKALLCKILDQCYHLDKLGITKEEFTRPGKHIIVKGAVPVLIDFERCHYTESPKNVTQFCQFLSKILSTDITKAAKVYKHSFGKSEYSRIKKLVIEPSRKTKVKS